MRHLLQGAAALLLGHCLPAQAAVTAAAYEAEAGTIGGGSNIQSESAASGGRIVGHIVDVGAYLQFSVNGGTGGDASLKLRVANGYSGTSRLGLYVNGVRLRQLSIAPTGSWSSFVTLDAGTATLLAGSNTIRIQHDAVDASSADLDKLDVAAASGTAAALVTAYEAESGSVGGGANVQSASAASGGRIVGHLVDVGSYLQLTVDGGAGGAATLAVRAANAYAAASRLGVYVNGVRQGTLTFPVTGSWNTFVDLTALNLTLAAGANTLRVQHDASDASSADLDRLILTRAAAPTTPDTQAPTPPSGLSLSGLGCQSATLSWQAASDNVGVSYYDIYHDGQKMVSVGGGSLSTALTLTPGANWGLYVNARDAAGNVSQASATLPVSVPQCVVDTQAPTVPTALRASATGTTVSLGWTAATDNVAVTAYDIYRDDVKVGSTASLLYTDAGRTANTSYRYAVAARDAQGNVSALSVAASVTTGSACSNTVCSTTEVATDTDIPWGVVPLADGRIVYSRRDAQDVLLLDPATKTKTKLGTVPNVQGTDGEGGLLGLAAAPGFPASDPWLYVYHTSATDNRIVRLKLVNGSLDTTSLQVLLSGIGRNKYHNGGRLRWGPDGMLYATTGDAQYGPDAQNVAKLTGKVLRLRPDGGVPADNPFGNYVWSYGHRNPQGLAFDSQGRLWEQEFGNDVMDETNLIQKGGNYGWPDCEGTVSQGGSGCGTAGFIAPAYTYANTVGSCSGIAIVRDVLYIACQRGTRVYRGVISGSSLTNMQELFVGTYGRLRTVEPSVDGGLWLTTTNNGDKDSIANNSSERILKINLGN